MSETPLYPVGIAPRHRGSNTGETSQSGLKVTGVDSRSPVWASGWQNWRPPARKGSRFGRGFLSAEFFVILLFNVYFE